MIAGRDAATAGFTLIEALIAVTLMVTVLGMIASVTAQWLPNWNRGFGDVQRVEALAVGIDRIVADLAAAEYVPAGRASFAPLFEGRTQSVTFVRTVVNPAAATGMEVVRLAEVAGESGPVLVRTAAPFRPVQPGERMSFAFADPITLLRAPFRAAFQYAGADRVWRETWTDTTLLPRIVRVQVQDRSTGRTLPLSTAIAIRARAPADCVTAPDAGDCLRGAQRAGSRAATPTQARPPGAAP